MYGKIHDYGYITLNIFACLFLQFTIYSTMSGQQSPEAKPAIKMMGLQMPVENDIDKNRDIILQGILEAAREGASFPVTPEESLSGYNSNFDQEALSSALKEIISAAQRMKVGLIPGTCPIIAKK
jgi:hypothetical protein